MSGFKPEARPIVQWPQFDELLGERCRLVPRSRRLRRIEQGTERELEPSAEGLTFGIEPCAERFVADVVCAFEKLTVPAVDRVTMPSRGNVRFKGRRIDDERIGGDRDACGADFQRGPQRLPETQ